MRRLHSSLAWIGVAILVLFVLGLLAVVVSGDQSTTTRLVAFVVAVPVAALAAASALGQLARKGRMTWQTTTLEGQPAVFVPYRLARFYPAIAVLVVVTLGAAVATVAYLANGYGVMGVVMLLITLYVGAALIGFVLAQRSRPGVVISQDLLEVRSLQRRTRTAWMGGGSVIAPNPAESRPVIRFVVGTADPRTQVERRWLPLRLERRGTDGFADVEPSWLGADWPDFVVVVTAVAGDPEARRELIGFGGPSHAL